MKLSIVVPAYNEAKKIANDFNALCDYLGNQSYPSEVIWVDDGSQDNTIEVLQRLIKGAIPGNMTAKVLSYGANRGKGFAVRYGISQAEGEIIAFMDSGLCVPLRFIEAGIAEIEKGNDWAIASRRLRDAKIVRKQPLYRRVGSKVFWYGMKGLMGINVTDTQCGFKFYRKDCAKKLFAAVTTDGFMFDIEALMLAKKLGFHGSEFAVEWSNDSDTRYNPVLGTIRNTKEILKIRWRING